jgi:hypothetical protein
MSNSIITFIVVVGSTPELDYELWSFIIVVLLFWYILAAGVDIKKHVSRNN